MSNTTSSGSIAKGMFGQNNVSLGSERRGREAVGEWRWLYQAKDSPLNSMNVILGENVTFAMV